jgi:ribosome biogenesis protein Nip4
MFKDTNLIVLPSGIWLVSNNILKFLGTIELNSFQRKIRYCGLYFGVIRRNFGLSLEALDFVKEKIYRFITLKGKTLQKFLYGKKVQITINPRLIVDVEYKKIIIMTEDKEPVGIGQIELIEIIDNNSIIIEIESIVDLGLYLRKEHLMFQ